MSKFHYRKTAIRGALGSPSLQYVTIHRSQVTCKHIVNSVKKDRDALLEGMTTLSILPDLKAVYGKIERNGIRADWQKVGSDIRCAFSKAAQVDDREIA